MKFTYSQLASKRIFGLDLVRSLSVCAVILAHSGHQFIAGFRYGVIAIEYFFVMSGFLVGEMLVREFYNGSTPKILLNFWIKRWFRTLPLYYLILILKIIFSQPFIGWKAWPYFLFLQNNLGGVEFFAVSWTLVIEEWFYLIMPLVIFLFFRKGITRNKFIAFSLLVIIGENILRILYVEYKDVPWGGIVGNFPFRFDAFMIGVFIAFIKVDYKRIFDYLAKPAVYAGIMLVTLGYIVLFAYYDGGMLASKTYWTRTIGFSLTSILLALQMPFLNNSTFLNSISDKNLLKQGLTWLSLLSYPMYLVHMDVLHFVSETWHIANEWLRFGIAFLIIIAISYLLIVFFHQPVTESRKKFLIK
ncbi:MAG TPA: acyltransferase [Bacteroidia bacterium]